jgi:hypothetical protein
MVISKHPAKQIFLKTYSENVNFLIQHACESAKEYNYE